MAAELVLENTKPLTSQVIEVFDLRGCERETSTGKDRGWRKEEHGAQTGWRKKKAQGKEHLKEQCRSH